ncbi:MAG: hypothetical protein FRX49_07448 [Trebouxia sp. A1-2]|nr:MAG: hypothetical protein FRX49_07448 [Trebouxia sp. A1-2]
MKVQGQSHAVWSNNGAVSSPEDESESESLAAGCWVAIRRGRFLRSMRANFGEDAGKEHLQGGLLQPLIEGHEAQVLGQVLKQDLDEDAAAGSASTRSRPMGILGGKPCTGRSGKPSLRLSSWVFKRAFSLALSGSITPYDTAEKKFWMSI